MAQAGTFPSRKLKERRRDFRRRNRGVLGAIWAFVAGCSTLYAIVFPHLSVPLWTLPSVLFASWMWVGRETYDGTHYLVAGRDAELMISKALSKWKNGWHVIDNIPFDSIDVDHVLIGRGGAYAIETKHTDSELSQLDLAADRFVRRYAEQPAYGARKIRLLLRSHGLRVDINPVVVIVGPAASFRPTIVNGVLIVRPRDLTRGADWVQRQGNLEQKTIKQVVAALNEFKALRSEYDKSEER